MHKFQGHEALLLVVCYQFVICGPRRVPATLGEQCNAEVTCEEGAASCVILLCGSKHKDNLDRGQWPQYQRLN